MAGKMEAKYIVVGGGIAGVSCAEQLSRLDPAADITLVSASVLIKAVTNFKKISRALESFDVQETSVSHLTEKCPNVTVLHAQLADIDPDQHIITLQDGQLLNYQKLCLCLGAYPKLINLNHPDVIGLRDTESIKSLQHKLKSAHRVIVVGNGGIATELVYELSGCQVVWVIKDSSIGSTFFDEGAATFFLPHLITPHHSGHTDKNDMVKTKPVKRMRYLLDPVDSTAGTESYVREELKATNHPLGSALGPDWCSGLTIVGNEEDKCYRHVHVEYNSEVEKLLTRQEFESLKLTETSLQRNESEATPISSSWPFFVKLSSGKIYGCDFIVSATGVVPNINCLQNLKDRLHISHDDGGILVDTEMRTSLPDVYAAGDVCSVNWPDVSNTWFQMRLWSQARQTGAYSANCMISHTIGEKVMFDFCFEMFSHVTKFFGYKVVLLGCYNAQKMGRDYELLLRVTKGVEYVKVILHKGRMVGAILIGDTDLEETFENLILNRMDLTGYGESLLDPLV